jgi:transposase
MILIDTTSQTKKVRGGSMANKKKYRIKLSTAEREILKELTSSGTIKVRVYKRARVLLLSDEKREGGARSGSQIAEEVELSLATVQRVRRQFVREGLEAALHEKARSGAPRKFKERERAKITALACAEPPQGHARWTLRLLAEKMVELELVESISHDTVDKVLKKTNLSLT